jgi:hypothetical protein
MEKKNSYTLEQQDMDTIIRLRQEKVLEPDTSVEQQNQSLQQGIGRVELYGEAKAVLPSRLQKIDKENISIFVLIKIRNHEKTRL